MFQVQKGTVLIWQGMWKGTVDLWVPNDQSWNNLIRKAMQECRIISQYKADIQGHNDRSKWENAYIYEENKFSCAKDFMNVFPCHRGGVQIPCWFFFQCELYIVVLFP